MVVSAKLTEMTEIKLYENYLALMAAVACNVSVGASSRVQRGLVRAAAHKAIASTGPLGGSTQLCHCALALHVLGSGGAAHGHVQNR